MVVEAHGGRISVEDVEGWTASFVVQMPADPSAIIEGPTALLS
jgi:signal transduction histidine kinase